MTDNGNSPKKDALKLSSPSTLSLTKTVESGKVKQNFQRGRSKTVTVEVKKTRTFSQRAGGMVEVDRGTSEAAKQRMLNQAEREARLRALQQAEKADEARHQETFSNFEREVEPAEAEDSLNEEMDSPVSQAASGSAGNALRSPMDDIAARNLERLRHAPSNRSTMTAAAKPAAARPKPTFSSPAAAPRGSEAESAEAKAKRNKAAEDASEYKRGGKLTIAQALGMDDEIRVRSMAQVKRQRAKVLKKNASIPSSQQEKIVREVQIPEVITVQELANRMAERAVDVIKELLKLGTMATVNQSIDADTAEIIVETMGHKPKRVSDADVEVHLTQDDDAEGSKTPRPPVVTIMGHVDHGKTSLLDALRKTDVVAGEAGGITQHIGAYQVTLATGEKITFLDTPGHEAFTAMRQRGAKVTDIVVLVVAADDGIMPQTIEAISHAKAAGVPIIVAVNKIDKPGADANRVKTELMSHGLVPEEFGGDTMVIEVSAKEKLNLDKLQETILLQAEVMELKANAERRAAGSVIESRVDRGRGAVATLLIQSGTLRVGDLIVAGGSYGRVRALVNDKGIEVDAAGPSLPVEVLGLDSPPEAGDEFAVVENEKAARDITQYRREKEKKRVSLASAKSVDQLFAIAGKTSAREFSVIVKSDVHGSAEAIIGSMNKFNGDEVKVRVIHSGVGAINESDVTLAQATGAMLVAFNVRPTPKAKELATAQKVEIRYYSIIYNVIDDIKAALSGLLSPERRENFIGYAEIREVFNITKYGKVAGCMITEGIVKRGAKVRLLRENVVIHEGTLKTLKRFKDEVKEVKSGFECGMAFENYEDIRAGDMIECFEIQEFARTVEARVEAKVEAKSDEASEA
ncbi:MAG: translation initiation factor IF-2 [Alphaproteobacteria bacterium]|nr:translation initiation factor IF-2 [Alphaproteobacteria bacterium]